MWRESKTQQTEDDDFVLITEQLYAHRLCGYNIP